MTDYAELLATKSQELAELTKALNDKRYGNAFFLARCIRADFEKLVIIIENLIDEQ